MIHSSVKCGSLQFLSRFWWFFYCILVVVRFCKPTEFLGSISIIPLSVTTVSGISCLENIAFRTDMMLADGLKEATHPSSCTYLEDVLPKDLWSVSMQNNLPRRHIENISAVHVNAAQCIWLTFDFRRSFILCLEYTISWLIFRIDAL